MTGDQTGILCDTGTHSSHMTWLLLLYREYQIGMEIQRGSRDHYLSRVVTFVARFQIEKNWVHQFRIVLILVFRFL